MIIVNIILLIICLILTYLFIINRKARVEIDTEREKYNTELLQQSKELEYKNSVITENVRILQDNEKFLTSTIEDKYKQLDNVSNSLEQSIAATTSTLKSAQETAARSFELEAEKMAEENQKNKDALTNEYLNLLEQSKDDFEIEFSKLFEKKQQLEEQLKREKSIVNAAIAANIRAQEEKMATNFYRLEIPEEDLAEIHRLREVGRTLRDEMPLNKVIWKVYYEKPTTDMIGRVVGAGRHTGIYKITNTLNGMCYVGQAVDIATRWKQHIKRALGAEERTKNKLYPAMANAGVENFTFEIVEECDSSNLDIQEDYWQDYFQAKDFGYSIK